MLVVEAGSKIEDMNLEFYTLDSLILSLQLIPLQLLDQLFNVLKV